MPEKSPTNDNLGILRKENERPVKGREYTNAKEPLVKRNLNKLYER